MFGFAGDWLEGDGDHPLGKWLLAAAGGRRDLDVTLLLMAGVHRDVLNSEPAAADLAHFFPTVGGTVPLEATEALRESFAAAVWSRREALSALIREATVQTNETARGLAWLLPISQLLWPGVHLVELGASAGLNLVAEQRAYHLLDQTSPPRTVATLGTGTPPQFTTVCRGQGPALAGDRVCPAILSRTGIDLAPFHLRSTADEQALASFVWGDQLSRMERLREGMAAFRMVEATQGAIRLLPVRLPDGLPAFLESIHLAVADAPVVLFNTTMTMYLPDNGRSLRATIDHWAQRRREPVIWLQWEPPHNESDAPEYARQDWSVDLWQHGNHTQWHLAWVHPHGKTLEWRPESADFFSETKQI